MNTEEREISLFDLLIYVAKGWRSILACMLIAGILNGGLQYVRELKNQKEFEALQLAADVGKSTDEVKKEAVQSISELRKEMSEDEIKEVDQVVSMEKDYDKQQEYMEKSLLMTMDADHISIARMQYWVDTDYEVNYNGITKRDDTSNVVETYLNQLRDNGWKKKAMKAAGIHTELGYFNELISIGCTDDFLTITVKYAEESGLKKITAVFEQELKNCKKEITEIFGDHDLKLASSSVETVIDGDISSNQQNHKSALQTLEGNIISKKAAFNDNQKSLYAGKIIISEEEEEPEDTGMEEEGEEEDELVPPPVPEVRIKNILLGAVLGAFLICMLRAMCYILSGRLKPEDNVDTYFGISGLGFIDDSREQAAKRRRRLDSWLDGLSRRKYGDLSKEQQLKMIVSNIALYCDKRNMKKLYFNSSVNCTEEQTGKLAKMLGEKGIEIKDGFSILQDAAAMEEMGRADGVVFFEQAGKSRYEDMEREIRLCREHEKSVIGMVVLI